MISSGDLLHWREHWSNIPCAHEHSHKLSDVTPSHQAINKAASIHLGA